MRREIFINEFKDLLEQLEYCEEWRKRLETDAEKHLDISIPFIKLRGQAIILLYKFAELVRKYAEECGKKEASTALDEDLKNFVTSLHSLPVAGALNDPERRRGDIMNAASSIEQFLYYLRVVFESVSRDVDREIPKKFVEHSLRNAGLVPRFEKLKEIAKSMKEEGR